MATAKARALLLNLFVIIGTAALLVLIVVLITGGFVMTAGPVSLSAHRPTAPLLISLAAWIAAWLNGRAALGAATASIAAVLDRHAAAIAVVIAAAAAAAGVAQGTYSAAGSDAAGYLSQAELIASGRLIRDEPLARQVPWPDATWTFASLGYRPGPNPGEIVPTYPPGLPLTMAIVRGAGGREVGPFLAVPLLGALAVLCTYVLGARLHSRTAGVVSAGLLATSPIFLFQIVQPMSDVPATAWWALAMLFALSPVPGSALAAGATAGVAVLTRPNLLPLAIPIAFAVMGWPRTARAATQGQPGRVLAFAVGMVPALGALALLQWRLHGSPLASGYGSFQEYFAISNIAPNLRDYGVRLLTGEAPALCLALASLAALPLARRRAAQPTGVAAAALIAALVAFVVLACYLPYGVFAEWSYLRFLLPAFPFAFVFVAALLVTATTTMPVRARGLVLVTALVAACSVNITIARREQAFNLHRYEGRYRTVGRYLDASLPPRAVVFAVQESASAYHYAGTPIVRWDMLRVDLDAAIATLRALGHHPVLLLEDFEEADFRARFPASSTARLDWAPRADIGTDTRVRLFDPADRGLPQERRVTDRFR